MQKFMIICWILLILAFVSLLLSGWIDKAANADNKLRYVIRVISGGVCLICIIGIAANIISSL